MKGFMLGFAILLCGCGARDGDGLNGKLSSASMKFADAAISSGLPEAALTATRGMLERDPRNVAALVRQGDALAALGRGEAASESYNRALEVEPTSSAALLGLGRVLLATGRAPEAEAAFRRALEDASVRRRLEENHLEPLAGTAAGIRGRMEADSAVWGEFIRKRGLRVE